MEQYFGTDIQVRLQRRADEYTSWMYSTAGACHPGRCLGCDDPDELGWEVIIDHLKRDGRFGFRMIPATSIDDIRQRLAAEGFNIGFWNVYTGSGEGILAATEHLVQQPLPEGLAYISEEELLDPKVIEQIQSFLADNGIPPVSGLMLSGQSVNGCTRVIRDRSGAIVATAYGYFAHNIKSRYHQTGWGGLVAVSSKHRGNGLGVIVNAAMLRCCIQKFGAKDFYEQVSAENHISQRMVKRCGLTLDESVLCGLAIPSDTELKLWGK